MRTHPALASATAVLLALSAPRVEAQDWLNAIKDKATQALKDQAQRDTPKESTASAPQPAREPAGTATEQAPTAGGQPEMKAVDADFVPGEKTIFYDDFGDMSGDEAPPHWKVRGGTAALHEGGGVRQLNAGAHSMTLVPNVKALPRNFTLEADVKFENATRNGVGTTWSFARSNAGSPTLKIELLTQDDDVQLHAYAGRPDALEPIGRGRFPFDQSKPMALRLWVQDGRLRLYVDGVRRVDANQLELEEIRLLELLIGNVDERPDAAAGLRRVRFAESVPDVSRVLASGRLVTHGILFDVDSDRLRAESAATIRAVAGGLQADASGRFAIEGHTDSSGDAAHNLELSKRRAEAVKSVLVGQFGIDAARLTTAGLGATRPVASNDTPAGRAENRRVEFVRH